LLIVANKFLTGFDEPLLHTMYVDKKLQGVLAVQTLSRLNRCNPKMQKQDTFVLDFYNSATDIKAAFDDFYTATSLTEPTDVNVLHDLRETLDETGIYTWAEVEQFNELFFNEAEPEPEQLHPVLDGPVSTFDLMEQEEDRIDFKIKAKQFVKLYGQLACIIPFHQIEWEQLHWFLKFLIPKLKVQDQPRPEVDALLESVDLSTYALERVQLNQHIELDDADTALDPENPNVRGYHGGDSEESPLDEIIRIFNERWFSAWDATSEEQRVKLVNILKHVRANPDFENQVLNNADKQNRAIALQSLITQAVNKERRRELELYKLYAGDDAFKKEFDAMISRILALEKTDPPA
jgi:type I restriction enzyme R subunit